MKTLFLTLTLTLALAPPAFPAAQTVELTPENTKIEWSVTSSLHTVHGTFKLMRGAITFDTASGAASGEVLVDVTSGESGSGARDRRMHSSVLESAKYPTAVFTPDRIEGGIRPTGASSLKLHGALTIHGETHEIMTGLAVQSSPGQLDSVVVFDLPYVAWGMKDPSNFLLRVGKSVSIGIHAATALKP